VADAKGVVSRHRAQQRSEILEDSPTAIARAQALRRIARAEIGVHRRLSKLPVKDRRRALAQWLQGKHP